MLTPIPRFAARMALLGVVSIQIGGCAGFSLDPRTHESTTIKASLPDGLTVRVDHYGPAPFWVEPIFEIEIVLADGDTTHTLTARRGANAEHSASLFGKTAKWVLAIFAGRATKKVVP